MGFAGDHFQADFSISFFQKQATGRVQKVVHARFHVGRARAAGWFAAAGKLLGGVAGFFIGRQGIAEAGIGHGLGLFISWKVSDGSHCSAN